MLLNKKRIDLQANTCSNAVICYLKLSLKSIPTNVEFYLDKSEMIKIFFAQICHKLSSAVASSISKIVP